MPGTIQVSGTKFCLAYTIQVSQPHIEFLFLPLYIDFYYSTGIHGSSIFFINIHKGYAFVLAFNFSLFNLLSTF